MKERVVWILAFLMLCGWLALCSISLAGVGSKIIWCAMSGDNLYVTSMVAGRGGNIWVSDSKHGVSMFDGAGWVRYGNACDPPMIVDRTGNMWFGFGSGSYPSSGGRPMLRKFDGMRWSVYGPADGLPDGLEYRIGSMSSDDSGNIWFGVRSQSEAQGGGIWKYDGATVKRYTTADGLESDVVISVAIDKAGNVWCGTTGAMTGKGGASRFSGKNWKTFDTPESGLARNTVRSITIGEGNDIWFATLKGVSRFDGKNWARYTIADGLADNRVWTSAMDKEGNMWFGTPKGVSRFDGASWVTYTTEDGLVSNNVWSIAVDRAGNVWLGTNAGVSVFGELIELSESKIRVRALVVKISEDGSKVDLQDEPTIIEVSAGETEAEFFMPMVTIVGQPNRGLMKVKPTSGLREPVGSAIIRISENYIVLDDRLVADMDALEEELRQKPKEKKGMLVIQAFQDVLCSQITEVAEVAKKAGVGDIGLLPITSGGAGAIPALKEALLEKKNECFLPSENPVLLIDASSDIKYGTISSVMKSAGRLFHNLAIKPLVHGKPPVLIKILR